MLKSQKEREGRDPNYVPPEPHFASVPTKPTDEKEEEEKKAKDSEDTKPEDGPDTPAMPTEATDEPASDIPELEPYTDPAAAFKVDDKVKVKETGKRAGAGWVCCLKVKNKTPASSLTSLRRSMRRRLKTLKTNSNPTQTLLRLSRLMTR
eukprot:TRINITY_DN1551_c0_g1_i2.p1 TRINITY_DN1551_c0_g1~~TRINITY_DN1551_c0_g1_i2.p1  ORF type:complete len:150 (+),score=50.73 TRINITY_DN1551_c0_g1_i2:200-649(+)